MQKKSTVKRNTLIIVIIGLLVLTYILKDNYKEVLSSIKDMNKTYILLAIISFFIYVILYSYLNYITVNDKKRFPISAAIRIFLINLFFSGITPFATGGEPAHIYMISKRGIKLADATNAVVIDFIVYQLSIVLIGAASIIYNYFYKVVPLTSAFTYAITLGYLINVLVLISLILAMFARGQMQRIVTFFINILSKIKIVKNKEKTLNKSLEKVDEFYISSKNMFKRKGLFTKGLIACVAALTIRYMAISFVIAATSNLSKINILDSITMGSFSFIISAFIPIPGASGGVEYTLFSFINRYLSKTITKSIVIVWRFITYYLPIIIGALLIGIEGKEKLLGEK